MSSSSAIVTPSHDKDSEVASSSIKRDIQRHASAADEMIQSIRNELFTPPGSNVTSNEDLKSLYDDDGELDDEILRLARVEKDIRQDLDAHNVDSIVMKKKRVAKTQRETLEKTVDLSNEERSGLVLFVLIAFWVVVYIKQWIEYNAPERIQK